MTTNPTPVLEATATITTDDPSRYLLQLCKHFRGKVPVEFDNSHGTITLPTGSCTLDAVDGALIAHAIGQSADDVNTLTSMVGRHLQKFDRHDRLVIEWS